MMLGKYFDESEFSCECPRHNGRGVLDHVIDKRLVDVLDAIRERVGEPVHITSGYRCPAHSAEVGGMSNSQHVQGTAADIYVNGVSVEDLAQLAEACGADGIGGGITIKDSCMWMCADMWHVGRVLVCIGRIFAAEKNVLSGRFFDFDRRLVPIG